MGKKVDIKALLEAGAHFGHKTSRWNPKMRSYIHSRRGGIHIIDLEQTAEGLAKAADFAASVAAGGKDVLFVGSKRHVAGQLAEIAKNAHLPYVTHRWFGGILTNFGTISARIKHYQKLCEQLEAEGGELGENHTKREIGELSAERDKLAVAFGGLAEMTSLPGALFIADVLNEKTAVREANRLAIPVIGIVDTNADPSAIDYVIPANDDSLKTVELIAREIAAAVTRQRAAPAKTQPAGEPAVAVPAKVDKTAPKPAKTVKPETATEPKKPAAAQSKPRAKAAAAETR